MIATYIQELLATNNRVIIPNYGAFLVRATSKSKDANTLKEKLKDIYFSPFLKFNDELLEKYVIKKEGVTKEQASAKIVQFIDDIKKVLEEEKPYKIEGFGQFTADKQGKVQFITEAKKETELIIEEKKQETETAPKKASEEIKPKEVIKEPKKEEIKPEVKEPVSQVTAEPQKVMQPQAKTTQTKSSYSYKKDKSVNKGLVWSIAIGVPVAAIFVWGIINIDTVKKTFEKQKEKTEKVAVKKKDTSVKAKQEAAQQESNETASQIETEKEKQPATNIKQEPINASKKYYIIAGSFKNEKYATSYLNKLQSEGYNAEKLAERNGMHAVSFNSFTDKRKAIAEYKYLAQEKGLQAWILYY